MWRLLSYVKWSERYRGTISPFFQEHPAALFISVVQRTEKHKSFENIGITLNIIQYFMSRKAANYAVTSAKTQVSIIYTISPTDPSSTRIYRSTLFSNTRTPNP